MSRQAFITTLQRRLSRVRYACNLADTQFWSVRIFGMISGAALLGAIEPAERDRLDDLTANAQNIREAELRAQGVFA